MKSLFRLFPAAALLAGVVAAVAWAQAPDPKFDAIRAKRQRGETLSAAEETYARDALAQRNQKRNTTRHQEYARKHPPRASTGLVPLPDLATGLHQGEPGGLYPDGRNSPPALHAAVGAKLARAIVPLDRRGKPAADGRIGFLTIGMSNTTQETKAFLALTRGDPEMNPRLALVDGAQGGQTAAITADPKAKFWTVVEARLRVAGISAAQVQVVWLKQANAGPTRPFPAEAKKLQADITTTLQNLQARFPNLKIAYLSSRTYGGYATTPLNPEPYAYETGFAVKWTIADQMAGRPGLNHLPEKGPVRAPWIAWGPYLWTDGTKGRADGLVWTEDDCARDGTHPSESGQRKVAELLLRFLKTDPTAAPWFLARAP